jgi:hypothetical protein
VVRVRVDASEVDDLAKDLGKIRKAVADESTFRPLFGEIAELLAERTRRKVPVRSGRARAGIVATDGRVVYRARHLPWLDFGGSTDVGGKGRRVYRSIVKGGRYLYPTLGEIKEEQSAMADAAVEKAVELVTPLTVQRSLGRG